MKATELLKQQHREVKELFKRFDSMSDAEERRTTMDEIAQKLQTHMMIEEEIFYPAVAESGTKKAAQEMVPEAFEEHHVVKLVVDELPDVDPEDERFEAKMTVLSELIDHHVQEEEKEMFKAANKLGAARLEELGAQMTERADGASGEYGEDVSFEVDDADDAEAADRPSRRAR
jgi:hypothetical protein